ncbi:RagB/SusD family nutrient uptake outer membrane protein [Aestuariibaculum sp. YM273]|uniref:RagB/SusD family nutrient uptake outer membrane protein n=1 Tax=Aestuariibaculum sp. YM273 TaxID=3070659 RepID=UPI0027DD74D8|nr:RagB/SusD family nutrient uptake outer membrane protein [Aestuariibaculum sp. YM273]WMI66092.1 RagB/SusD family nutrient uptake outer membrane protein [Aestuariibaculum sp. YM273]
MIRNKKYIFLLAFAAMVFVGCTEEYLETAPTDSISESTALSNEDNMYLVVNGLHRMMYGQNQLTGGTSSRSGESHFLPMFDAVGGNIIHSSPGNGWMTSDLKWTSHTNANATTGFNLWFQRYHFIEVANAIINKAAGSNFTETEKLNNVLGQAYAYRAWAYWRLVTTFSKGYLIGNPSTDPGVPILLNEGAPYEGGPRGTVEDVYTQIYSDINTAISYLGKASAPEDKSHISINAAYGIKARVALSKGDWQIAADNAALARNGYPLLDESGWLSGFNTNDLSEVIWGGYVIDTETNYYQSYFYYVAFAFNGSQNRSNPKLISKELYDRIPSTDYRNKGWLPLAPNTNPAASNDLGGSYETDPNYDNADDFWDAWEAIITEYGATSGHNTHPYMNVKFKQKNPGGIDPDDVIYMRSSEMVLIEAEAKAMLNDVSGAQNALDILGSARDSAFDKTAFTTQAQLMDEIKWQRRVELWGEGFSYHDNIRWDEGLDQTNSGASEVLYQAGFMQDKPSVNDDWIFQIPQDELDANPFLTEADQN